jgi:serine/threonine protein kinase
MTDAIQTELLSPAAADDRASRAKHERLVEALAEYHGAIDAGAPPDRSEFLQRYPDLAPDLAGYLDGFDFVHEVAPQLRGDDPLATPNPGLSAKATLGDFRILREIGRGGMGVVYEAEQLSIGRRVALKVLPFAAMLDRQQLNRFKNEARAAGTLDHPNIVSIHSVGCDRGVHYYAMQLIEGQSLAEVIDQLRIANRGLRNKKASPDTDAPNSAIPNPKSASYSSPPLPLGEGHGEGDSKSAIRNPKSAIPSSLPLPRGEGAPKSEISNQTSEIESSPPASSLQSPASLLDTQPVAHLSTLPDYNTPDYYRTIARLGAQAAEALDHAHQNGILHRDIKPANLLLECNPLAKCSHLAPRHDKCSHLAPRDGRHHAERDDYPCKLWITDFGLARIEQEAGLTMTGDIVGTIRYMSPEQALGQRAVIDHRSDIYSLGVTLYELITLQPAFPAEDRQELLRQIAFDEPHNLQQINKNIPQDLETIVLKAIEKNPADRYATAQDFASDLRQFSEDRAIHARRPRLSQRAKRFAQRHRTAVLLGIVASILASLAATAALADRHRRIRESQFAVETSLNAARQALEADDVNQAATRLTEAQARVDASRLREENLVRDLTTLRDEADRYREFQKLADKARTNLTGLAVGIRPADEALALYKVIEDPDWLEKVQLIGLRDAYVERIKKAMYKLLLLKADHLTRWEGEWPPATRQARLESQSQDALKHLERAVAFHAPSRGYYWLSANCALALGDKEKEKRLRATALETPPDDVEELFFINRDRWWGTVSKNRGYPVYSFEENYKDHREMLRLDPTYFNAMYFMTLRLEEEHRYAEALVGWYGCSAINPRIVAPIVHRGIALSRLRQFDEAKVEFDAAIARLPDSPDLLAHIAFILATEPDREIRDGPRAMQLAEKACKLTEYQDPATLDALACAYAEIGSFQQAVKWSEMAVEICETWRAEGYEKHRQSFRQNKPWREE